MSYWQFIRAHLMSQVPDVAEWGNYSLVRATQTDCEEFSKLCRSRMTQGYYRYHHDLNSNEPGNYDAVTSAILRLRKYQETGNQEHLVDVANLMLVEFKLPTHPRPYFQALHDEGHSEIR
jgi:hypothetical protein